MRQEMSNSDKDRAVFRRTAVSAKKINVEPKSYRGGYRM